MFIRTRGSAPKRFAKFGLQLNLSQTDYSRHKFRINVSHTLKPYTLKNTLNLTRIPTKLSNKIINVYFEISYSGWKPFHLKESLVNGVETTSSVN